jgi:hypothetical protein
MKAPVAAKIAVAMQRTTFIGMRRVKRSPASTAGILAITIPSVVPATT